MSIISDNSCDLEYQYKNTDDDFKKWLVAKDEYTEEQVKNETITIWDVVDCLNNFIADCPINLRKYLDIEDILYHFAIEDSTKYYGYNSYTEQFELFRFNEMDVKYDYTTHLVIYAGKMDTMYYAVS